MKVETVDLLVVGLPVAQFLAKRAALQKAMTGTFEVGRKRKIVVKKALVVPQPQGALFWYAAQSGKMETMQRKTLVMDVGARTFDWLVTRGMRVVPKMSDSVNRGVSDILRHIADAIGAEIKEDYRDLDAVDAALRSGRILRLYQRDHDLKKFDPFIRKVADQALISVLGRLDGAQDLENIILVGGGAYLYMKAVKRRFPKHTILEVDEPMYANVRGFQLLGEQYVRERPELFQQGESANDGRRDRNWWRRNDHSAQRRHGAHEGDDLARGTSCAVRGALQHQQPEAQDRATQGPGHQRADVGVEPVGRWAPWGNKHDGRFRQRARPAAKTRRPGSLERPSARCSNGTPRIRSRVQARGESMDNRNDKFVSASDLARLGYCERQVAFDATYGRRSTKAQRQLRQRGLTGPRRLLRGEPTNRGGQCHEGPVFCGHPGAGRVRRDARTPCVPGSVPEAIRSRQVARWLVLQDLADAVRLVGDEAERARCGPALPEGVGTRGSCSRAAQAGVGHERRTACVDRGDRVHRVGGALDQAAVARQWQRRARVATRIARRGNRFRGEDLPVATPAARGEAGQGVPDSEAGSSWWNSRRAHTTRCTCPT